MNIETLVVGPIETNCYVLSDPVSREAVVIDAGDDGDSIWQVIQQKQLQVKYILNTHGHFDHIQANDSLRDKTGAPLAIHADDAELLLAPEKVSAGMYMQVNGCREPEILLHNGDVISFGPYQLRVIYTPGHTKGGCCYYEEKEKALFSGDTIFMESIGRTDLPTGNTAQLLDSVRNKVLVLPDDVKIYPGHGPETTVAYEAANNPYA